ncbi:copper-binding protein [Pseudooceanicola sp. MF1-13]|uniref:copper-binding protein n=1 Tax=Pseudooceanicola sp. MF1-13 TaxID=3379095 RepID=UPI0038926E25
MVHVAAIVITRRATAQMNFQHAHFAVLGATVVLAAETRKAWIVADPEMMEGLEEGQEVAFTADRVKGKLTVTEIMPE